jgi:hypothetical protein
MDFSHWFLLFWTVVVLYNFGAIWFVQLVVYPLFGKVGPNEYVAYHKFYSSRIPLPVILPGFACFLLPVALVFFRPESVPLSLALTNVACGMVGLFVTVALEIPRHARLEKGGQAGGGDPGVDPLQLAPYFSDYRLGAADAVDAHRSILSRVARAAVR